MKNGPRWIAQNSALILLALALGALVWIVALEREDPTVEDVYPQSLPVSLSGLAEGMTVVGTFDEYVRIVVRAPQSVWNNLDPDDFLVIADLADLEAGIHQAPVQVSLDRPPSRVISVEPRQVTVELERQIERLVPVQVYVEGKPALGYIAREANVTPTHVTIVGPSSYVPRVLEAAVWISVQGANVSIDDEFPIQLLDEEGDPVPNISAQVKQVQVQVPIELHAYYRPLVVKVILEGEFAAGYRITNITVDPPSVTVFGSPNVLNALPGYIETEPINLEGAQADIVVRPALDVPESVSVVMERQPVVRISIEPLQSSRTIVVTPRTQGLEPNFAAKISPETVEIILSGPLPMLESISPAEDVRVVLDLFDRARGTYQIEPEVIVPEGVTTQSILPSTLQVEIFSKLTPTPTVSPPED
ncbi:MAG TPA: hypothetical protein ENN19_01710 [Chloroflexi bacterium]|nr:hypothetical protein [Chloroflexota bacterium]